MKAALCLLQVLGHTMIFKLLPEWFILFNILSLMYLPIYRNLLHVVMSRPLAYTEEKDNIYEVFPVTISGRQPICWGSGELGIAGAVVT